MLAAQRGEEAPIDQFLNADGLQQIIKQGWLVGDETMPKPEWRGGQTNHAQGRVDHGQLIKERAIFARLLVVHQMALINDDQINVANLFGLVPNRLDARERDRFAKLFHANAGRVNPQRGVVPMLAHLLGVLLDQLLDMRQHEDLRLRP